MTCYQVDRDERGAATVFGVALIGLLIAFAFACCAIGSVVATHRRAESAADLAALAGAQAEQDGSDGCAAAAGIATANGAELTGCQQIGFDVLVRVVVPTAEVLGHGVKLPARARAGPSGGPAGGPVGDRAARLSG